MGMAYVASETTYCAHRRQLLGGRTALVSRRGLIPVVRVNSSSVGASLPGGRGVLTSADRPQQQPVRLGASSGSSSSGNDGRIPNGVVVSVAVASAVPSTQQNSSATSVTPAKAPVRAQAPQPAFTPVPEDVIAEFEHKLEADLQTVGVTLTAILGVIIFWRGVWALLDHFIGDSVVGDICCVIVGLTIVLYIRLSGMKIASFWPPS